MIPPPRLGFLGGNSEYCESVIQIFIKSMAGYIGTKPRSICTILSRLERDLYGH